MEINKRSYTELTYTECSSHSTTDCCGLSQPTIILQIELIFDCFFFTSNKMSFGYLCKVYSIF